MLRLQKSKSRTSLLADLMASDEPVTNASSQVETPIDLHGILHHKSSPKELLKEILGDFFIDAEDLKMKELIGEGGFAVVHRCLYFDPVTKKEISVAMKALKPNLINDAEDLREFLMEASIQKKLHHRNIVKILGVGATDCSTMQTTRRSMFILQEFVPGKTLKDIVIDQMCNRNKRVYTIKQAVGWLLDVAYALHYLHEVCRPMIVHRDLKLDNILLSKGGGLAKLCDFGLHKRIRTQGISPTNPIEALEESFYGGNLAQSLMDKVVEDQPSYEDSSLDNSSSYIRDLPLSNQLSMSGSVMRSQSLRGYPSVDLREAVSNLKAYSDRSSRDHTKLGFTGKVGSVVYMAPEVFLNKEYDEKVDVYSFGVMMYELLVQTNLSVKYGMTDEHESLNAYAERVASGYREEIPDSWPDVVKMLVSECWDEDPANRPSFTDVIHRLTFINDSGIVEKIGRPLIDMNFIPIKCCCIQ